MGTIPPKDLLNKWAQDNLPVEMAVGHLLQHLVMTENSMNEARLAQRKDQRQIEQLTVKLKTVKAELHKLQTDMAQVLAHLDIESKPPKRPRGRLRKYGPKKGT